MSKPGKILTDSALNLPLAGGKGTVLSLWWSTGMFVSAYSVPGTLLATGDPVVSKTDNAQPPESLQSCERPAF